MILITGGAGQLATEFQGFFKKNSIDFLAPNRLELDITDFDSTDFVFDGTKGNEYTEEDEINPISV